MYQTTRWDLVAAAARRFTEGGRPNPAARTALAELYNAYRQPICMLVQRSGIKQDDAEDLVQSFFTRHLVEKNELAKLDPQLGRFRSWLYTAVKNFVANERRRTRAQIHGGGIEHLPIDGALAVEDGRAHEPADPVTPDQLFDRQWAITLLGRVLGRLQQAYEESGELERFEQLRGVLVGDEPYQALADRLGGTAGALRVEVCRLRHHYRALVRDEVQGTLERSGDVDSEIRHLMAAMS